MTLIHPSRCCPRLLVSTTMQGHAEDTVFLCAYPPPPPAEPVGSPGECWHSLGRQHLSPLDLAGIGQKPQACKVSGNTQLIGPNASGLSSKILGV